MKQIRYDTIQYAIQYSIHNSNTIQCNTVCMQCNAMQCSGMATYMNVNKSWLTFFINSVYTTQCNCKFSRTINTHLLLATIFLYNKIQIMFQVVCTEKNTEWLIYRF